MMLFIISNEIDVQKFFSNSKSEGELASITNLFQ